MFFQQLPYHLANEEPNDLYKYMKMVPLGYCGAQTLLLPSDMVSVLMQAKKLLTYRTCSYVQHVVLANGNDVLSLITVDGVDSLLLKTVSVRQDAVLYQQQPHTSVSCISCVPQEHLELCLHGEEPYGAALHHFSVCDTWLRVCNHFQT